MIHNVAQQPSSPSGAPTAEFPILNRIRELQHFLALTGPKLEGSSVSIDVESIGPSDKFSDLSSFQSPFNEEITCLQEMQAIVKESNRFIAMTYCYRSCSKALPMMKNEADENMRKDIHQKTFSILRPEIAKLHEFAAFYEKIIEVFVQNFKRLVQPASKGEIANDDFIRMLQIVFDRLIILDALKDMKACLQNDFARYKRSFSNIRAELPDSDAVADDVHNLQMFLGNPQHPNDLIVTHLRSEIQKIPGHEDVIVLLADDALRSLQKQDYLLQDEKHILERVLINTVFLLDGESKRMSNAFKYKKFDIEAIRLYFKGRPFLPLFGDMHLNIKFVLKRCTNFDSMKMEGQWFTGDTQHYLLIEQKQDIESEFNAFKTSFVHVLSSVKAKAEGRDNALIDQNLAREVFDRVLDGFKLISKWNTAIKEQSAYKRANPIDNKTFIEKGGVEGPGFSFECVDRYNYSNNELSTLCAVISMLKSIGSMFREAEPFVTTIIRKSMHDELQQYLQGTLSQPLRKAYKRGKDDVRTYMCMLRWIAADWSKDSTTAQDYKSHSKDKGTSVDFPKRCVQPTYTQMLLLRRVSLEIFSEKSKGMQGGIFTEKNVTKDLVPEFERFYDRLFFYPYLLDYKGTLSVCLDMSDLWYREFYLEITKCVQFPISMSLPFILAEHVVNTPQIADSLLLCIDIYNDAANRALNILNQQFIFREVEAELNLAFHTLVHTLAMNIFTCFKAISSAILLDHDHKHWQDLKTPIWKKFDPSAAGFVSLMQQRDIRLLGRSVDLRRLLAQHINGYFRQNIDMAISRFESCDLTTIIDLKSILDQTQLTHRLLLQHLSLDPYQSILLDVNAMTKFPPFCGRIVVHIYSELLGDLIPNFCLNNSMQLFRRGPMSFTDPMPRDSPPPFMAQFWYTQSYNKVFADALKATHDFFGPDHLLAMINLLDPKDFVTLFEQIYCFMEEKVNYVFASYAKVLIDSMDPMKLPSFKYGVIGGYGYFDLKLKPIACYENLRSELFQAIKEIGNTLAFIHQLSLAQCQFNTWDMNVLSYFEKLADTASKNSQDHLLLSTEPLRQCAEQSLILRYGDQSPSLLTVALERLYNSIEKSGALSEWVGKVFSNHILDLETPKDLCRLWSTLQFIFLNPTQEQINAAEPSNVEIFGDGFSWAGMSFLHLCGFRSRFEALDFVYYILRMQLIAPVNLVIDPKKNKKSKADPEKELFPFVKKLLEDGSNTKLLNSYILSIVESHFDGIYEISIAPVFPEIDNQLVSNLSRLSTQSVISPTSDSLSGTPTFSSYFSSAAKMS